MSLVRRSRARSRLLAAEPIDVGAAFLQPTLSARQRSWLATPQKVEGLITWPEDEIPHSGEIVNFRTPPGMPFDWVLEEEMERKNTPMAGMFWKLEDAILALPRRIVPADGTPGAKESADLVRECLTAPSIRCQLSAMYRRLLEHDRNGIAFVEVGWADLGGEFKPIGFQSVPMRYFGFRYDRRQVARLHVRRPGDMVKAPAHKFLYPVRAVRNFPWGDARKDYMYRWWKADVQTVINVLDRNDEEARPSLLVPYNTDDLDPEDAEKAKQREDAALDIGEYVRGPGVAAYPEGQFDPQRLHADGGIGGGDALLSTHRFLLQDLARAILAQAQSVDLGQGPGSHKANVVAEEISGEKRNLFAGDLCTYLESTLFRSIVDLNIPGAKYPRLIVDMKPKEARKQLMEAVRDAFNFVGWVPRRVLDEVWGWSEEPGDVMVHAANENFVRQEEEDDD